MLRILCLVMRICFCQEAIFLYIVFRYVSYILSNHLVTLLISLFY